jgi:hypothetical protein
MGFAGFLRGFARPTGGLLARGFNAAVALVAAASYFYDSRSSLRFSAAAVFSCLSCSFWQRLASLSCARCSFYAAFISLLDSCRS